MRCIFWIVVIVLLLFKWHNYIYPQIQMLELY
jgi:hypothetical protein